MDSLPLRLRRVGTGLGCLLGLPLAALGQFPSQIVGFNDNPDVETSHEMFQIPQFSGTTAANILANTAGQFDWNNAWRASGFQSEGVGALNVFFDWADPNVPEDDWVRLTTFNGEGRPNPALDTRGKVRFDVTNIGSLFDGQIGICLGIRETGGEAAQLADGGVSGPIEWVGVDTTVNGIIAGPDGLVDTVAAGDDVQEYPLGFDIAGAGLNSGTAVISPGNNGVIDTAPAGDDEPRAGYFIGANGERVPIPVITLAISPAAVALEWDLSTGIVRRNNVPQGGGIAPFTGNGTLADAPNDRGTLEHIALVRVLADSGEHIDVWIDRLQFEATVPDPTPPPSIQQPVSSNDTQVQVDCIPDATLAELFINDVSAGTAAPVNEVATFGGLTLSPGDILTATQTANGDESGLSPPVTVFAPGVLMADSFDSYASDAELAAFWSSSISNPTPSEARVRLQPGGAASCPNFLREDNPSNSNAARLYRALGGVNGTDADPLRVAWHFKYTGAESGAGARTRFELAHFNGGGFSAGQRGDGTVGITLFNQVAGPLLDEYNAVVRIGDPNDPTYQQLIGEGWIDAAGFLRLPTGVVKQPGVWHEMEIEVGSSYVEYRIDGAPVATIPRPNNVAYDFVIIGEGFSNNGPLMMVDNVAVTRGAGFPFAAPAPPAPSVVGAVFPGGTSVSLADLDPNATLVEVFSNGGLIGSAAGPFPSGTATVGVSPSLANGAAITAVQTIGGVASCASIPAIVSVPPVTIVGAQHVPGQTAVEVGGLQAGLASAIRVYANDTTLIGTLNNPATDPVTVTVVPLNFGDTITATQTISGIEGPPSAAVEVSVPAPTVAGPVIVEDAFVMVDDVHPLATTATVYVNGAPEGSAATGGNTSVTVPVGVALAANDAVRASQTIGGIESPLSSPAVFVEPAFCEALFNDSFDVNSAGLYQVLINDNAGEGDAAAIFAYDYGAVGVPPAPNGSGDTLGVRFEANTGGTGAPAAVVIAPVGLDLLASEGYRLSFDLWLNANGPFPAGGAGSTLYFTCGVGHDEATVLQGPPGSAVGPTAQTGVGAWFQICNEGGAADDLRAYKDLERQYPSSGQYAAGADDVSSDSGFDPYYTALFGDPGPAPPPAQGALFPNQTGNTGPGAAGFAWHEVTVTVVENRARWAINGTPIVTIDTELGNPFSGLDGSVALGLEDAFASLPDNPTMAFAVVDNLRVFVAGPAPGDVNGDGAVDVSDLGILLGNFGTPSGASREDGDVTGDGAVDISDLGIVLGLFNTSCP